MALTLVLDLPIWQERNLWAATRVQALWRGYLSRKAAAGGGKKGKKGKKGKGGKKKK